MVRYRLADKALGDYDIALAAKLVHDLKTPPNDEDPDGWWLRRARILIFAGEVREAATLLNNLLEKGVKLDTDFAERYLQALFDLQSIGQHAIALPLLEGLYNRVDSGKLRRELLYWQAESQAGLGHHRDSAELYLRSATYGDLPGEDPWGTPPVSRPPANWPAPDIPAMRAMSSGACWPRPPTRTDAA